MTRLAAFPLLVRPAARSLRWSAVIGGCGGGLLIAHLMLPRGEFASLEGLIRALRVGAFAITLAVPFAFEDAAEETISPAPTPLWARRAARLVVMVPVLTATWGLALLDAGPGSARNFHIPVGALTLEFAAVVAGALALTAAADRLVPDSPGVLIGGPAMLVVAGGLLLLPAQFRMFVSDPAATLLPGDPPGTLWNAAHHRWWLALGAATLVALWFSRDPGRRTIRVHLPRRHHAGEVRPSIARSPDTVYERVP